MRALTNLAHPDRLRLQEDRGEGIGGLSSRCGRQSREGYLTGSVDAAVKKSSGPAPACYRRKRRAGSGRSRIRRAQWINWRDSECQDVAPFEAGMGAKGGDPRLACIIDQDAHRISDLNAPSVNGNRSHYLVFAAGALCLGWAK